MTSPAAAAQPPPAHQQAQPAQPPPPRPQQPDWPHRAAPMPLVPGAQPGPEPVRAPRRRTIEVDDAVTPRQAEALSIVRQEPGCTIVDVARRMGCTHATATYHLNALSRLELVRRLRDGRDVRHFVGGGADVARAYVAALARDPRKARVIAALGAATPLASVNALARGLRLPYGFVKRTILQLQWARLVRIERRHFRYAVRRTAEPELFQVEQP